MEAFPSQFVHVLCLFKTQGHCNLPWQGKGFQLHLKERVPQLFFTSASTENHFPSHLVQARLCVKQFKILENSCCCIWALKISVSYLSSTMVWSLWDWHSLVHIEIYILEMHLWHHILCATELWNNWGFLFVFKDSSFLKRTFCPSVAHSTLLTLR